MIIIRCRSPSRPRTEFPRPFCIGHARVGTPHSDKVAARRLTVVRAEERSPSDATSTKRVGIKMARRSARQTRPEGGGKMPAAGRPAWAEGRGREAAAPSRRWRSRALYWVCTHHVRTHALMGTVSILRRAPASGPVAAFMRCQRGVAAATDRGRGEATTQVGA